MHESLHGTKPTSRHVRYSVAIGDKAGPHGAPLSIVAPRCVNLLARRLEHLVDVVPVDQIFPERLEIVGPAVAVVDV